MSDDEAHRLIFHSGLSTSEAVDMNSGRGVGLDLVADKIKQMGGNVDLQSTAGKGSSVTLHFPMDVTLNLISGMILSCHNMRFIIPTENIIESVAAEKLNITKVEGKGESLLLRDEIMPLIRSRKLFGAKTGKSSSEKDEVAIVIHSKNKNAAIIFDSVLDIQQIVIKNISGLVTIPCIIGGAILADGTVGMVIDTEKLIP
jgi:two-component system chemotaxis sensor kinase CheA